MIDWNHQELHELGKRWNMNHFEEQKATDGVHFYVLIYFFNEVETSKDMICFDWFNAFPRKKKQRLRNTFWRFSVTMVLIQSSITYLHRVHLICWNCCHMSNHLFWYYKVCSFIYKICNIRVDNTVEMTLHKLLIPLLPTIWNYFLMR